MIGLGSDKISFVLVLAIFLLSNFHYFYVPPIGDFWECLRSIHCLPGTERVQLGLKYGAHHLAFWWVSFFGFLSTTHLEPKLQLFKVWEIMVRQIIIDSIAIIIFLVTFENFFGELCYGKNWNSFWKYIWVAECVQGVFFNWAFAENVSRLTLPPNLLGLAPHL